MGQPSSLTETDDDQIAVYEVSEDGVHWRPYDPVADRLLTLHRRIEFAPPGKDEH
ncbi:MAG: hypothetical protein K2P58_09300 [Hyphomonadaceae bacterium]|nr:hypothetical protein [Hyphomonadaceae bacterium]